MVFLSIKRAVLRPPKQDPVGGMLVFENLMIWQDEVLPAGSARFPGNNKIFQQYVSSFGSYLMMRLALWVSVLDSNNHRVWTGQLTDRQILGEALPELGVLVAEKLSR